MTQTRTLNPLPTAATFSKDPKMWGADFSPQELHRAKGAKVKVLNGRWYLDWVAGLGATILGYSHAQFNQRVKLAVSQGIGFSLPYRRERIVAEKLVNLLGSHVPGWTPEGLGVRFGLSGTDATTMAVRLARAVTGRMRVLSVGYHGWSDMFISTTPPAWGIPRSQCVDCIDFNDQIALRSEFSLAQAGHVDHQPIAAVIIEQPPQEPELGYWELIRRLCTDYGSLLIVDEVVTWPRYALGGACEYYGIEPDIICIAKALGNGIPISAMVFRREYGDWFSRQDPCFVSSTGFGNAVSLAAADAVLDLWTQEGVNHLWRIGNALMVELKRAGYSVIGNGPRSLLQFASNAERGYFIAGMRDRGVLLNRPNLPNASHTLADVEMTVKAAREVRREIDALGPDELAARMAGKEPMVLFENR